MTMSLGQLLDEVGVSRGFAHNRIWKAGLESRGAQPHPWYVHTAVAGVIWVGAVLFAGFLAALRLLDDPGAQLVLGVASAVVGALGSRVRHGLWRLHLSLIAYAVVTGSLMMFGDRGLHLRHEGIFYWAAALQVACLILFDSRPVRFKATMGLALTAFFFVMDERLPYGGDALLVGSALFTTAWWLWESKLAASLVARAVRPVGFALVVSTVALAVFLHAAPRRGLVGAPLLDAAVLALLVLAVGARAAREAGVPLRPAVVVGGGAGAVALGALASDAPALVVPVLLLALGRLRKEPLLDAAGAVGLVVVLARIYHDLELSLLWTSFGLAGAGALVLVARAVVLRGDEAQVAELRAHGSVLSPAHALPRRRAWRVLLPSLLVGAVVLALVVRKEQQLARGQTILLRLAPADPRSLLQGDYMTLRYELASDVRGDGRDQGTISVVLDHHGVATAIRSDALGDRGPVATLKWHRVRGEVAFGADSFFFAEGQGARFARARFAEVRVTPDGTPLLVGLLDEGRRPLAP